MDLGVNALNYFKRVSAYTPTQLWINNVTRRQAELAIGEGAVSCTQNPVYLSKVLNSMDDGTYLNEMITRLIGSSPDDNAVVAQLQRQAIAGICEKFLPLYEQSGGRLGLVSIQADPFAENTETILDNADKSLALAKNFIIKIPVTKDGLEAIGQLIAEGIPVLATEVMSMDQVLAVCSLHRNIAQGMKNPAPFWMAHINGIFDEQLQADVEAGGIDIAPDVLRQASLLLGRKIHSYIREKGFDVHYMAGGARNLRHFTDWVGVDGGVTINWDGTADKLIEQDGPVIDVFNARSSYAMIDELLAKVPSFKAAWTPGSLEAADYEHFGPVVRFRTSFEKGWVTAKKIVIEKRRSAVVNLPLG